MFVPNKKLIIKPYDKYGPKGNTCPLRYFLLLDKGISTITAINDPIKIPSNKHSKPKNKLLARISFKSPQPMIFFFVVLIIISQKKLEVLLFLFER